MLVQKIKLITSSKGGIKFTETHGGGQLNYGIVVAMGPGRLMENGKMKVCQVKEGETVLLPEFGGSKVVLEGG